MGLLDSISTATGGPSSLYLKGGRHVIRITRTNFREGDGDLGPSFRIDGELLKTTNMQDHESDLGNTVTANDAFKYKKESLARMRRMLTAALSAAEGRKATEAEITSSKAEELCGPNQPLVGAIVAIIGVTKKNKTTGTPYTLYEAVIPNDHDLEGLVL
jgi:hypothetical protein